MQFFNKTRPPRKLVTGAEMTILVIVCIGEICNSAFGNVCLAAGVCDLYLESVIELVFEVRIVKLDRLTLPGRKHDSVGKCKTVDSFISTPAETE